MRAICGQEGLVGDECGSRRWGRVSEGGGGGGREGGVEGGREGVREGER